MRTMLTAVLAALAVASPGAQDAPSAGAPTVTVTDHKLSETTTNASIQSIQVVQSRPQPGLDVHIRPIDPAGDLLPKLFSA
jgi:hypothetical protein